MTQDPERDYPAVAFIVKYGGFLAPLAAAMYVIVAVLWAWLEGNFLFLTVLVFAAPIIYLLARSYVELVRLLADMLLPK